MPTIKRTMRTTTPPQQVWDYLADFENTEEWDPPTRRTVRVKGDGGTGTVYHNTSAVAGRETEISYTVVEHDAPRLLRLEGRTAAFDALDTIEVVPRSGGGTEVTYTADFRFTGVAKLALPVAPLLLWVLGQAAQRQMQGCLDDLAA